ncbi:MAG: CvpA family protein [bacterium]|nr:CvpA family protein [bacterium]
MITPFDLVLILILFAFALFGFWFGLLHAFGALVGTVVGAIVASRYYTIWSASNTTRLIAFIVIFTVASRLTGFIFLLIEKFFKIAKIVPGVSMVNRLAGGLFGLAEGAIVLGAILYFIQKFPIGPLSQWIAASQMAALLLQVGVIVVPLFPEVLRQAKTAGELLP